MNLKLVLGPLPEDWQDVVETTNCKEDKVFALGAQETTENSVLVKGKLRLSMTRG